ncbi:MAG: hypothetical protein JO057_11265 [Chloroflexi bacterium]|nr:hypothetical protein [Chloroflexota bacterium]
MTQYFPDDIHLPATADPFLLPADRQGWRGLTAPGNRKRKWWTLVHNEQVLVTALLLTPGELTVRHSHESGELSIHYDSANHPVVSWHPPGEVHPSLPSHHAHQDPIVDAAQDAIKAAENSGMAELLSRLIAEHHEMRQRLDDLARRQQGPRIIVDVLFPPFKTTIEDPAVDNNGHTVVGQWYD